MQLHVLKMEIDNYLQYDRIDPAEVQSLKDEIEELKSQKVEMEAASQSNEEEKHKQEERVSKCLRLDNAIFSPRLLDESSGRESPQTQRAAHQDP